MYTSLCLWSSAVPWKWGLLHLLCLFGHLLADGLWRGTGMGYVCGLRPSVPEGLLFGDPASQDRDGLVMARPEKDLKARLGLQLVRHLLFFPRRPTSAGLPSWAGRAASAQQPTRLCDRALTALKSQIFFQIRPLARMLCALQQPVDSSHSGYPWGPLMRSWTRERCVRQEQGKLCLIGFSSPVSSYDNWFATEAARTSWDTKA